MYKMKKKKKKKEPEFKDGDAPTVQITKDKLDIEHQQQI